MTFEKFMAALEQGVPPADISPALTALWWMQEGDWKQAHNLINDRNDGDAAWVHAHLHRVEGDLANANYWYRRAGKTPSIVAFDIERSEIIEALLRKENRD